MDAEIPLQFQQQQQQQPGRHTGGGGGVVVHHHQLQNNQLQNELTVVRRAGRQAVRAFLESHNCFAVLKTSAKVVVFDTRIPIQLAFYALVEHGESSQDNNGLLQLLLFRCFARICLLPVLEDRGLLF